MNIRSQVKYLANPLKQLFIKSKWQIDNKQLPLANVHWHLYRVIHNAYFGNFRRFPNLINPSSYNDCIQWLKLFDQRQEIVQCTDKIQVRSYVEQRVGSSYLLRQFEVYEHFDLIDFAGLPEEFVIKTNHDSGSVMLVSKNKKLDLSKCRSYFDQAISNTYGENTGEWAYAFVRPAILIEEYLEPYRSTPIPDYKFHCVNGEIKWVQYIYDRNHGTKECVVDRFGNQINIHFSQKMVHSTDFKKPIEWDELCNVACLLSRGWKYVRVDLYASQGRVYFGEMTFFPLGGFYRGCGQKYFGKMMNFDFSTYHNYSHQHE